MKIFLDHCVPKRLAGLLASEHKVITARQMTWETKKNGELLKLVEGAAFDVFLTVDQSINSISPFKHCVLLC